ncbi:MAG TPA: hypothetical protein PLC03_05575 [Microthrixaceae bacterium]|nr:hypothetical protein [Microthrixaceae bacterium]
MSLVLLPNTAALTSAFLRAQDEVSDLVDDRVYTILPNSKTFPLVRVRRIGGTAGTRFAHWLDAPLFQVDAWADTAAVAFEVTETCRAALVQRFSGIYHFTGVSGVVTSVEAGGITEGFDPDEQTKARGRFDAVVMAHPAPDLTSS